MTYRTSNPQGRIAKAARRTTAGLVARFESMEPRRLLSAGDLDATFGVAGLASADVNSPDQAFGQAVAIQADGKIVVAGYTIGADVDFAVARYNTDGTLDASFGGDGAVTYDFASTTALATSVAIQPDGKIVVGGYAIDPSPGGTFDFALIRLESDGSLDAGFGTSGKVLTDFNTSDDTANSLALQADGKIILAGVTTDGDNFALARYDSTGALDPTFGAGGKVTTDFDSSLDGANSVKVLADGSIVAAGFAFEAGNYNMAAARYDSAGALDAGFSGDGKATIDFAGFEDNATGLAVQTDGKLVLAGYAYNTGGEPNFALARLESNGAIDAGFGTSGTTTTDFVGTEDVGRAVALQADGKIVVAGYANAGGYNYALARYNTDGSADAGFGTAGKVTTDFATGDDQGQGVAVQADGKIVAAGFAFNAGSNFSFGVARYEAGAAPTNDPPVANAGGPYAIVEGDGLSLDASASTDPDLDSLTFAWDIDNDGDFDDATGATPTISWATLQSLLASDDGNGSESFVVKVRADDGQGNTNDASATVALGNAAPTATFAGGSAVGLYSPSSVSFSGQSDPSSVDTTAGFTYSYDFNNDGDFTDAGDIANSASPTASFTYSAAGTYTVRGRIADKDGGFTDYTTNVTVTAPPVASVIADPINPSTNSALLIYGTELNDIVTVALNGNGAIQGTLGGTLQFAAMAPLAGKPFGRVIVHTLGGNDIVVVASVGISANVFAGEGNDSVLTGSGNDILVGGGGNDRLYSGSGADLTIGGTGADLLRGDGGNDVLISGTTNYDNDLFSLVKVATGVIPLSTSFMYDDAARDTLTGNSGVDRFFANQSDGVVADIVTDQNGSEAWEDLV